MPTSRLFVVLTVVAVTTVPALAGGNVSISPGLRIMSDDELFDEDLERQASFGFTVDFGGESWPVHIALGAYGSRARETFDEFGDTEAVITEFNVGLRKTWSLQSGLHSFVGAGAALIGFTFESEEVTQEPGDSSVAPYLEGGLFWRLGSRFNLGASGRIIKGTDGEDDFRVPDGSTVEIEGDFDYVQLGLLVGWGWPAN